MPKERELKFEIQASDVNRLKRSALFRTANDRRCKQLTTAYYDTPKHRLFQAGFSLRVRECEGEYVQSLKAQTAPSFGVYARDEWEWPVSGPVPDLDLLADTPLAHMAEKQRFRENLSIVFETRVERTARQIKQGNAEIEIAVDDGVIVAGGRSIPIYGLELELKDGPDDALFALVPSLPKAATLCIDVLSKSERGYALLRDSAPHAHKAESVALDKDATAAQAFQAVMKSCLRQFRLNEPGVLHDRQHEALHQARVAIRRCRSGLSFFKPLVADEAFDGQSDALRRLSRRLGEARDLDVFLASLDGDDHDNPTPGGLSPDIIIGAKSERERLYDELNKILRSDAHRKMLLSLATWVEQGPWSKVTGPEKANLYQSVSDFAHTRLKSWRRKVKNRGQDLGSLSAHDRHRVRIAAKNLRYASEFMKSLCTSKTMIKRHEAFIDALEALQADLGILNDQAFGHQLVDHLAGRESRPDTPLGDDHMELIAHAERSYQDFLKAKAFWP